MQTITYRKMTPRDFDAVTALWRATPGIRLHDDSDSRACIARYLRRNPGLSLVACCKRQIIGAVLAGHDSRRGYLHHLAVAPEHRGRGVGRILVARSLHGLARQHIPKCNVFVLGSNRRGLAFWKHHGWELRRETPWLQHPTST